MDVKKIMFVFPPDGRKRLPGCPHITWLKIVQTDIKFRNFTLTEALDMAQNCPLWKLLGRQHSVLHTSLVQAHSDDDDSYSIL